ncbi:MAG: YdcH family protein [Sphingomonadales bacterium]|nr:YdcH family protein [Sphingomonadales bacterium]
MPHPHAAALQTKHSEIDRLIESEEKRPAPDSTRLADLKRRKLKVKEEIAGL